MTDEYMTLEDATKMLGVTRATLYYYIETQKMERKKFPLDKHVYLKKADVERVKRLKEGAQARLKKKEEIA